MPSFLYTLFALAALCSSAIAATPVDLALVESDTESNTHSRALLAGCQTKPFAQCGGRGSGGKAAGVWACCPSGYTCKKYNSNWYSCQKGAAKPKTPAQKRKAAILAKRLQRLAAKKRQAAIAAKKQKKAPKKTPTRRRTNRLTGSSLRWTEGYQNPTEAVSGPACDKVDSIAKSHPQWCGRPKVTGLPKSDRPGVMVGRQTIFNGPAWTQIGHCAKRLWPTDSPNAPINSGDWRENFVKVALSSKYMNGFGAAPCDQQVCLRVIGFDESMNPTPPEFWKKYVGLTMPGIVYDRCGECDDDHIDILSSYPYTKAPQNEGKGAEHNKIWTSGFYAELSEIYAIGIVKVEWGFNPDKVPCNGYF